MQEMDLSKAVEISDGIHWVGTGTKNFLSRNAYLRCYNGSGKKNAMVIDPGPTVDLDVLIQKVSIVLGSISQVNMVFMNHQDPDVVGNAPFLARSNPNTLMLTTEDTWRLVCLSGLDTTKFRAVERFKNMRIALPTGHKIQFVPTPFCHFRGACMLYDLESRILFSGDFLGGVACTQLYATRANWHGVKAFHQLYMPSNEAIRLAVRRIRELQPPPLMIAPQHGSIIKTEDIPFFLEQMENLQVGLDIIMSFEETMPQLIDGLNEIVSTVRGTIGEENVRQTMKMFHADGSYPAIFSLTSEEKITEIKGDPIESIESLIRMFFHNCDESQKSILKSIILRILISRDLPTFDTLLAQEYAPEVEFFEDDSPSVSNNISLDCAYN
ncbi:MAG: MBL fold metallo-hydrolase [Desulfuromonadaceae bacterium]